VITAYIYPATIIMPVLIWTRNTTSWLSYALQTLWG